MFSSLHDDALPNGLIKSIISFYRSDARPLYGLMLADQIPEVMYKLSMGGEIVRYHATKLHQTL